MPLSRVLAVFALFAGITGFSVSLATQAGATAGITYFVNSPTDTSATDCTLPTNTDCGIDDAIDAFNSDTTADDADTIDFASGAITFISSESVIDNAATGVTLTVNGDVAGTTTVSGNDLNGVFDIVNGTVIFNELTMTDGQSSAGAAVLNAGTVTLTNDTLTNDSAGEGGAIYNSGTATLFNDTLSGDSASFQGGGIQNYGSLTMTNGTLSNDSADSAGGGIFNNGTVTLTDDTFTGDSSLYGGALFIDAPATLTDDTLSNDTATVGGGGIYNEAGVSIANSILDGAPCSNYGTITDGGYNVESDNSCDLSLNDVTDSATINLATSLASNGSSGPETLALDPTSSAYEEVPAAECAPVTLDERGDARPGAPGTSCDAGAFEYQAPPEVVVARVGQVITFAPIENVSVDAGPLTPSAFSSSGLAVTLSSLTPAVCSVNGSTLQLLAAGTCTIVASQSGDSLFLPAANVTQTFAVGVAPPSLTVPGRPHIRSATARSSGRVVLDVSRPTNGGSALLAYQYSIDGRAWVSTPLGGQVVVTRAPVRRVVTLRVRARNAIGTGLPSNTVRVTFR